MMEACKAPCGHADAYVPIRNPENSIAGFLLVTCILLPVVTSEATVAHVGFEFDKALHRRH
jgi:hypothetical protein